MPNPRRKQGIEIELRVLPPTAVAEAKPALDEKKVFEIHHEALKDAYKEFIDTNQKFLATQLLVVGWFGAQKNPLPMLCGDEEFMLHLAVTCCLSGFVGIAWLFQLLRTRARNSADAMSDLGFKHNLYARYEVSRPMFWIGLIMQFVALIGITSLILYRYHYSRVETCNTSPPAQPIIVWPFVVPEPFFR